jgi:hypothetical protein
MVIAARYLSAVLQRGRLTMSLDAWKLLRYPNLYRNPLFRAAFYSDSDDPCVGIFSNHNVVPALNMVALLEKKEILFPLYHDDTYHGEKLYPLDTQGNFPLRWLYMIDDFHISAKFQAEITEVGTAEDAVPHYTGLLEGLPIYTRNAVMFDKAFEIVYDMSLVINDPEWDTSGCQFSSFTKQVLDNCMTYGSTGRKLYTPLRASQPGLEIPRHRYMEEWLAHRRSVVDILPYRNEFKGHHIYTAGGDVTLEELVVLSECIRVSGNCKYILTYRYGAVGV